MYALRDAPSSGKITDVLYPDQRRHKARTTIMARRNAGSKVRNRRVLLLRACLILKRSQTVGSQPMATIDLPASLSSRVMNALKADARTVDLRGQAAHFFTLGARMLELFEEEEMADVLSDVSDPRTCESKSTCKDEVILRISR
jgi:hypothetical protein